MTIDVTAAGLAEINGDTENINGKLYAGYSNYTMRITYTATINSDTTFVYGQNGNDNKVVLTWKRTSSDFYDTLIDDCHVYSFGIDLTKLFSDTDAETAEETGMYDHVKFMIYNETDGYWVTAELNETEGVYNKPRYATLRGIGTDFIGEANGSDKRFSFSIPAQNSDSLHLFESAIDLLSFATLVKQNGGNWQRDHLVSLAGVYKPKENLQESSLPLTLKRYLSEYPNIQQITLRLDNDKAGGYMAKALVALLSEKYEVSVQPPPCGKDYNDYLCMKLGIPITHRKSKAQER